MSLNRRNTPTFPRRVYLRVESKSDRLMGLVDPQNAFSYRAPDAAPVQSTPGMKPLSDIPIGVNAPIVFNTVIEIPKGSTNKYEYDQELGAFKLDRVLYSPLFYPFDYGFIPQTRYLDGDPIDVLVMISHPVFPGCVVEAKALGVLEMQDEKGPDEKLLCVATKDPRFAFRKSLNDLQEHTKKEIFHFFEVYKTLEEKSVEVVGWKDVPTAIEIIEKYRLDRS